MPRVLVNGVKIEYDIADCEDKVIVLSVPMNLKQEHVKALEDAASYIKSDCNAKTVIVLPKYVAFKTKSYSHTIKYISRLIEKLTSDKKKIEKLRKAEKLNAETEQ